MTEMLTVEAFDEDTVNELRTRARNALLTAALVAEEKIQTTESKLLELVAVSNEVASKLADVKIFTRDSLAELSTDELVELTGFEDSFASELIMQARAHWFEKESEENIKKEVANDSK